MHNMNMKTGNIILCRGGGKKTICLGMKNSNNNYIDKKKKKSTYNGDAYYIFIKIYTYNIDVEI